ncbi:MAG: pyridoxal phosphate-dependent aminotransferase family protein [Sulfurimonadaceae bacterium]|jgi:8-amino-7-oxononanoate synthase|nr:pyridoxal phosphate-dependent aminotransferase family protein [Sulfurimonadaceae bacterium]
MYYENELKALKKVGRYRTREIVDYRLLDFSSNDYLGLAHKKELHSLTCHQLSSLEINSSKASLLVSGYHKIHQDFEQTLCALNHFEDGVVLGSGFNANIALIEALVRKGDVLFMDEKYHASGVLASTFKGIEVHFFPHNDMEALKKLFTNINDKKRKIVAVEGIYSMDGDMVPREVFEICDREDALLIVDEAHSSGVVGPNLLGVFDLYNILPRKNHIKMGTLGKAYGSFGAYILASEHIVAYLLNRAKPIIYATSLSLYDTLLAHNALKYMQKNKEELKKEIQKRQEIVKNSLGIQTPSLIVPIVIGDNKHVMKIKEEMASLGFSVGAIREPTVPKAIIRVIARLGQTSNELQALCDKIRQLR